MTEILQKQIPYPRPTKLSDPNYDFTPEECAAILAVPDERMGFRELGSIFQSYLPAGTYEERAYFIPRVLRFLDDRGDDASDIADNFLDWVAVQKAELESDGLLLPICVHLQELLRSCLSELRVQMDPLPGKDVPYPIDCSLVESLIVGLNRTRLVNGKYRPFGNAATPIILDAVGTIKDGVAASWFAIFASLLERGVFLSGEAIDAPIYDMLTDKARIAKACHLVCEASRNDRQLAVFWRRWCWKGAFLRSFED